MLSYVFSIVSYCLLAVSVWLIALYGSFDRMETVLLYAGAIGASLAAILVVCARGKIHKTRASAFWSAVVAIASAVLAIQYLPLAH